MYLRIKNKIKKLKESFEDFWNRNDNKIFVIGFNKTGTTTVHHALLRLGISVGDQVQAELLTENISNNSFDSLINYCQTAQAFQDIPFSIPNVYKVLDDKFPNSKFILTIRDSDEQWFNSLLTHHSRIWGQDGAAPTKENLASAVYRYEGLPLKMISTVFGDGEFYDKKSYCRIYNKHNYDVIKYFRNRPKDLLIINVSDKDSYLEFCSFIKKRPKGKTFEWKNKKVV